MQRSLRSLLSEDVADFTGLMSGKVKYYVGKLSATLILLSMKLSGNLVMSHWKTELRMISNNIYMPVCQPGTTIGKIVDVS